MPVDSVSQFPREALRRARRNLLQNEDNVQDWATRHGYNPKLVYQVLSGTRRCIRGKSREIAVQLGLIQSSSSPVAAGKVHSSPTGHTLGGAGAVDDFNRTGKLQLVGEALR